MLTFHVPCCFTALPCASLITGMPPSFRVYVTVAVVDELISTWETFTVMLFASADLDSPWMIDVNAEPFSKREIFFEADVDPSKNAAQLWATLAEGAGAGALPHPATKRAPATSALPIFTRDARRRLRVGSLTAMNSVLSAVHRSS